MIYKEYKNNSFNLYTIKTDKFKTCHMEIIFYNKFEENKITINNALVDMIVHSSKKYNKRKKVVEKLEDLYSASFYGVSTRLGNIVLNNFVYNFIDPKFAEKSYLKDVIKFPFEMIFNPNIKNNEFDERTLNIIKNRILVDIESIKESPNRYAIKRALINTDDKMPASYYMVGNIDDLNKINTSNLVDEYKYMLDNFYCDIYLIGNLDMDKINIMICDLFKNNIIKTQKLLTYVENNFKNSVKEIVEQDNFEQDVLVTICNLKDLNDNEKNNVMPIFNNIFGSGSLNNKLGQNLREKNSLCYQINSMYQKYDNLLIIMTGIDKVNKNKAVKLIKKSIKEMISGDFDQESIDNAIKSHMNGLKNVLDNQSSLINNYFFHNLNKTPLIMERINNDKKVSKKEIIDLAKKIKISTIYLLESVGNK